MPSPLTFWNSPNLALPRIRHGFTHRTGGISEADFDTLNLGLHVSDDAASVIENRRRVAEALGFPLSQMVCAAQVHGADVAVVSQSDAGRGAIVYEEAVPGADALVTDTPGLLLALFYADCVPVFFVGTGADGQPVVGVAHAGWRGMVGGVLENTAQAMRSGFGVTLDTLHVAVGPHIGAAHFEVGEEVATQFPVSVVTPPESVSAKPHVALGRAARLRLEAIGLAPHQVHVTEDCTVSLPELYFSHRRDFGKTGRMAALIAITD